MFINTPFTKQLNYHDHFQFTDIMYLNLFNWRFYNSKILVASNLSKKFKSFSANTYSQKTHIINRGKHCGKRFHTKTRYCRNALK